MWAPLAALKTVGSIGVVGSNIVELGPLPALTEVGSLLITKSPKLSGLAGLGALQTVSDFILTRVET